MSEQQLRMSDAEREQAAAELGEHYAQGRLTAEEHAERLDQVWAARTRGELAPIFADLPGQYGQVGRTQQRAPFGTPFGAPSYDGRRRPFRRGIPGPVLAVLAILLVFTVVTHLPLIVVGLLVWWFVATRHRRRHPLARGRRC